MRLFMKKSNHNAKVMILRRVQPKFGQPKATYNLA